MSSPTWSDGYVADTPYTVAYHASQSPAHLALVCALNDVAWSPPDREALTVLELGCGRGYTACALAAANPGWRVVGVDYHPAHIADAREFAAEAGIGNASFLELDLGALDEATAARLLPQADVIMLHGVWTWVSDQVRAGIKATIRACLVTGGVAMVSYNALPGWANALGARFLINAASRSRSGPSDQRAAYGIETLRAFAEAGAHHLKDVAMVDRLLKQGVGGVVSYVAHEYLPDHWRPAFAAEAIRELAEARLDHVGSASLEDNFPPLILDEAQREAVARLSGPDRETAIDICVRGRSFRQDVFVRGRRRAPGVPRLRQTRIALAVARERVKPVVRTPLGEASLPPHVAGPVLEALAGAPRSIGELGTLPGVEKTTPGELVAVLVGGGWCLPLWRDPPPADSAAAAAARRFNLVALNRYGLEQRRGGVSAGIAAPAAGAAYPCPADELAAAVMIQDAAQTGEAEPDVETLLGRLLTPDAPAEVVSALRERLSGRIPGWRMLGLI